ncbi:MAG: ral secretion pathway protein [Verrucomicrobiota bacterium]
MNYDEFAFFNQQLAVMLRDGIPLEAALRQLCAGMRAGPLRAEMQQLEADLARGTPLKEALAHRALPPFYIQMVEIGVRSNDLPGVLTLLADYYHRANALWTRLKGLMVYPLIVVVASLGLTLLLSSILSRFLPALFDQLAPIHPLFIAGVWIPPVFLGLAALLCLAAVSIPSWRASLRWRLPAFREASLAQLASAITLMLRNGATLAEALAMAEKLEATTSAGKALAQWRSLVETGQGKPAQWPAATRPFPPLFLWLVQNGGEDVAAGFQKAAEIYRSRASYRIELALYGALPISILLLGQMILWQIAPLFKMMIDMMNMIGDAGGKT